MSNFRELQRMLLDAGFVENPRRKKHIKYVHPKGVMVVASCSDKPSRSQVRFEADVKRAIRRVTSG